MALSELPAAVEKFKLIHYLPKADEIAKYTKNASTKKAAAASAKAQRQEAVQLLKLERTR